MSEYYLFSDNMNLFNKKSVPVEFSSEKQANSFIHDYENFGGYKQFNIDYYGDDKTGFIKWLDEHHTPNQFYNIPSREPEIVKYKDGWSLYTYMMSIFGIRIGRR